MIIVLSFIGTLPDYIIESIHQIRCYYEGEIYLIINDTESEYLNNLKKYNVNIINYQEVIHQDFLNSVELNKQKFQILQNLIGREELFIRSFERFFLLRNFLFNRNFSDCLFLELDNLIYDDPNNWIKGFNEHELCYMFDNYRRFSSGLMYVKNSFSLDNFLECILNFINNSTEFMTEMTALSIYYDSNNDKVQILPTYWECNEKEIPSICFSNYNKYNDSIFDALAIGCFLLGLDKIHTNNVITKNLHAHWCLINYTNLHFEWKIDEKGRKKPYVWNGNKFILINNLHVHSKDLKSGLSLPITE